VYLRYTPDGGDIQEWTVQLGRFRSQEIEQIERITGLDYGTEFKSRLLKGNGKARRALLWTLQRRDHPRIKFEDVDFADDELTLVMDRAELEETREMLATVAMPDDERAMAYAMLERQISEAPEPPGKANTGNAESATG